MAKNFKIADIKNDSLYSVSLIDNWDGSTETKTMTGDELKSFTNAAAHLYDNHATEIEAPADEMEEKKMTRYEKIKSVLEDMDTAEIIAVHNEYCNETNNMDDYIYEMGEFDEIMGSMEPWEIARACFYGHEFCPAHDYFRFNGYANLESFDFAPEGNSGIYISDIADYIDRNEDALNNDEIQEILDEYEEGENDE